MSEQSNNGEDNYYSYQGRQGPGEDDDCSAHSESDQDATTFRTAVPQHTEGFVDRRGPISYGEIGRCRMETTRETTVTHESSGPGVATCPNSSGVHAGDAAPSEQSPGDPVSRSNVQVETKGGVQSNVAAPAAPYSISNVPSSNGPCTQPSNQAANNPYATEMLQHLQAQLMAASLVIQHRSMTSVSQVPSIPSAFNVNSANSNQPQLHAILQNPMLILLLQQFLTQMSNPSGMLTVLQQLSNVNPSTPAQPTPNQFPANMTLELLALQAQLAQSSQFASRQGATASNVSNQGGSLVDSSHQSGLAAAASALGVAPTQLGAAATTPSQGRRRTRRRYQAEAFPSKLHRLICDAMREGKSDIGKVIENDDWFHPPPSTCISSPTT
eukprot:scaffold45607_cov237-Amphora_coffeaeformis.AAC.4